IEGILHAPAEGLGRWARFLRFQIRLWGLCARRLRLNNASAMSAALSFRTIFAMIPVIVVAFLVLKSVGVLKDSKESLRQLLDKAGVSQITVVDEAGEDKPEGEGEREVVSLADKLEGVITGIEEKLTLSRIGPIGVILLIWAALKLLTTLERSLNRIFEAPRSRSLGRRTLLYWSAVTLGPIVLVAASYAGRAALDAFTSVPGISWLMSAVGWAGPPIVGIVMLAALYTLMPNTRVRFRAALGGALVAVPTWLVAKWAFSLYVTNLVGKGHLYGVLGLLPLFLIWMNVSWLIFLFGAELAHAADNVGRLQEAEEADRTFVGAWEFLAVALAVADGYTAGRGPATLAEISSRTKLPEVSLHRVLKRLTSRGIVCAVDSGAYVPARPAERIRVAEVLEISERVDEAAPASKFAPEIDRAVARIQDRAGA
ncbi:MAG: YhjD/YihY/BrkB family envelope integrity protein, partial [Planctomycetia bacterium]|nr:YhjD/YihY/BrkB family envelope integrity protein [Planctomycetia bacterium]